MRPGPADLTARLLDARITGTDRRGKYLWCCWTRRIRPGAGSDTALVVHLGMSGQMLLGDVSRAPITSGSPRCSTTGPC